MSEIMSNIPRNIESNHEGMFEIFRECEITEKEYRVAIKPEDFEKWISPNRSEPIQEIFPYLDADQREFLRINLTPAEYEELYDE